MTFRVDTWDGWTRSVDQQWSEEGIRHAFLGRGPRFRGEDLEGDLGELCRRMGRASAILPRQVHSAEVVVLTHSAIADLQRLGADDVAPADGLFAPRESARNVILAVLTADCLPILMCSQRYVSVVHAGWRGVAAGIIERAVECFPDGETVEVVIGPAAQRDHYEVQQDVIDALRGCAVAAPSHDRYYLDLPATAAQILRRYPRVARVSVSSISTLTESGWYSHRREGIGRQGSNLAFLAP
jgi:YfiH family protein